MNTNNVRECPTCGGTMSRDIRPDTITYNNKTVIVDQPGWYCNDCDEVVLTNNDVEITDREYVLLKNS